MIMSRGSVRGLPNRKIKASADEGYEEDEDENLSGLHIQKKKLLKDGGGVSGPEDHKLKIKANYKNLDVSRKIGE